MKNKLSYFLLAALFLFSANTVKSQEYYVKSNLENLEIKKKKAQTCSPLIDREFTNPETADLVLVMVIWLSYFITLCGVGFLISTTTTTEAKTLRVALFNGGGASNNSWYVPPNNNNSSQFITHTYDNDNYNK